jgi:hypothetical protein
MARIHMTNAEWEDYERRTGKKHSAPREPKRKSWTPEHERTARLEVDRIKRRQESEERGTTAKDLKAMAARLKKEKAANEKTPAPSGGVLGWLGTRSRDIAHEMQETPARERREHRGGRRRERYDAPSGGVQIPRDPFGVGGFDMAGLGVPGASRRSAPPAPRKRKRRRHYQERSSGGSGIMDIPEHMRWMF